MDGVNPTRDAGPVPVPDRLLSRVTQTRDAGTVPVTDRLVDAIVAWCVWLRLVSPDKAGGVEDVVDQANEEEVKARVVPDGAWMSKAVNASCSS